MGIFNWFRRELTTADIEDWPAAPVNVRVCVDSGVHPMDCVFSGYDQDGIAMWTIMVPPTLVIRDGDTVIVSIDELPPRTRVRMSLSTQPDDEELP